MLYKKFPESFQGTNKKNNYFEGWYNKIVAPTQDHIYAFIPTIALNSNHPHSAIQVFDGFNVNYHYLEYPLESFTNFSSIDYHVKIGSSVFSSHGMKLNIQGDDLEIKGILKNSNITRWPKTLLQPGAMGWLSYFPFLETYHGIVSMSHNLNGILRINDLSVNFNGGKGYIEKDWGKSFPKAWIWMHSNHFLKNNISFMFSIAKIPLLSFKMTGFLSILWFKNRFYKFTSYNFSKIEKLDLNQEIVKIIVSNHNYTLKIMAVSGKKVNMKAPISGNMRANCIESMNSKIYLELYQRKGKNNILLFKDVGTSAGLEIMDNGEF
ncbi:MAG: hypothetical protein EU533_07185 [Promethearchaeota archaeon]|nr:MAG: hypothetical protein EU533_07185 [Candidatus Lokiarchaeota archaeon]